jgi:hypothetical protein
MAKKKDNSLLWIALAGGALFLLMRARKATATKAASAAKNQFDVEIGPATVTPVSPEEARRDEMLRQAERLSIPEWMF